MNQFHGKDRGKPRGKPQPQRLFKKGRRPDEASNRSPKRSNVEDLGRLFEKTPQSLTPKPLRLTSQEARPVTEAVLIPIFDEEVFCDEVTNVVALVSLIRDNAWRNAGKINEELLGSSRYEAWARDVLRIIGEEGIPDLIEATTRYFTEIQAGDPTVTHLSIQLKPADVSTSAQPVSDLLTECVGKGQLGAFIKPSYAAYEVTRRFARALFRVVQHDVAPHLPDGVDGAFAAAQLGHVGGDLASLRSAGTAELVELINRDPTKAASALMKGCTVWFRILSHSVSAADMVVAPTEERVQVGLVPRLAHEMIAAAMTSNLRCLRGLGVDVVPIERQIKEYCDKPFAKGKLPPEESFYSYVNTAHPDAFRELRDFFRVIYERFSLVSVARTGMFRGLSYTAHFDLLTKLATTLRAEFPELLEPDAERSEVPLGCVSITYEGRDKAVAILDQTKFAARKLDIIRPGPERASAPDTSAQDNPRILQGIFFSPSGVPIGNEFVDAVRGAQLRDGASVGKDDPLTALWSPDPEISATCRDAYKRVVSLGHKLLAETPALRACISEFGEVELVSMKNMRGVIISSTWDEVVESIIGHSHIKLSGQEFNAKLPCQDIEFELGDVTFWQLKEAEESAARGEQDSPAPKSEVSRNLQKKLQQDWLSFFERHYKTTSPKLPLLETFLRSKTVAGLEWHEDAGKGSHSKIYYTDPETGSARSVGWAVSHHNGSVDKGSPVIVSNLSVNLARIGAKVPWELLGRREA